MGDFDGNRHDTNGVHSGGDGVNRSGDFYRLSARLPGALGARLVNRAQVNRRTIVGEVESALEMYLAAFEDDGGGEGGETGGG